MKKEQLNKIISDAIDGEIQAHDCYSSLCRRASDPQVASLFEALAQAEKEHRDLLRGLLEKGNLEFELDDMSDTSFETSANDITYSEDMNYEEAINMAIKDEEAAAGLYLLLADTSADTDVKNLFTSLAKHEAAHKSKLEKLLENKE